MTQVEFGAGISEGRSSMPWAAALPLLLEFALPAVIGAGGTLFGAGQQARANRQQRSREEEAAARQAASMEPFLEQLIAMGNRIQGGGDYSGMRAEAMSNLDRMSEALNAQLAQRGIYSSGAALGQQRQLTSDVLSQLSQAIAADQLARQQSAGQYYAQAANIAGSLPGLGYADLNISGLGNLPSLPGMGYSR